MDFLHIVGLDMSLTSPGIAVFGRRTQFWNLYAFAQRKREIGMKRNINSNARIELFGRIPSSDTASDAERYKFIVDHIIQIIPEDSIVLIEGYAFVNRAIAGSNFKLHELGGFLKVKLLEKKITNVHSIVSSCWKKAAIGKGNATKNEVVDCVLNKDPFIDLMKLFQLEPTVNGEIPCPVQDLADAIEMVKGYDKYKLTQKLTSKKRKHLDFSCAAEDR